MSSEQGELLIVGSNSHNQELLELFVARLGYKAVRADSLAMLDTLLDEALPLRFALVDITGFDAQIWDRCARLHARDIPLLVISAKQSDVVRRMSYAHGAQSVMGKPLMMQELADAIHGFMQAAA